MFSGFWLTAASAHEPIRFEVCSVGTKVAGTGSQPCEEDGLAVREGQVEVGEGAARGRGCDSAVPFGGICKRLPGDKVTIR